MYDNGKIKRRKHCSRWKIYTLLLLFFVCIYVLWQANVPIKPPPRKELRSTHHVPYIQRRFDEYVNISGNVYHYSYPIGILTSNAITYGILTIPKTKHLRDAIRQTWGFNSDVYFICAGKWEDIEEEDSEYHDMIWLDSKEVYNDNGYSILPIKSQVLIHAFQKHSPGRWLVKTDDDSYIFTKKMENILSQTLFHSSDETLNTFSERLKENVGWKTSFLKEINYYGRLHGTSAPVRLKRHQWYVSESRYPGKMFPVYGAGAGYVVSKEFSNCAVRHLPTIRHMPMEDVMTGMLADVCHMKLINSGAAIQESDYDIFIGKERDIVIRHHVKTPTLMKALWLSEKITGKPSTFGLFHENEDVMKHNSIDRGDWRIPHISDCDGPSPIFMRSGFLDYRPRQGKDSVVIVIMAEIEKTFDVHKFSGCLVASFNDVYIASGTARIVPLQLESDTGYSWIRQEFPFLTHRQVFVHCTFDTKTFPMVPNYQKANLKVSLYRLEHGKECQEKQQIAVNAVIPSERPEATNQGIEICVAVFRPSSAVGFPVHDMIYHWVRHYKSFDIHRINVYVDNIHSIGNSLLYSEKDHSALKDVLIHFHEWAPQKPIISPLWFGQDTKKIEIGDGKTFYWSQGLAYNDCIYNAASRGSRALVVDFDEFVTGLPNNAFTFTEDALSFAWILHHSECPTNVTEGGIWNRFKRNEKNWQDGPRFEFEGGVNGKSLYNSWNIVDVGVHQPQHCMREPCTFTRINNQDTGIYVAHVRSNKLKHKC